MPEMLCAWMLHLCQLLKMAPCEHADACAIGYCVAYLCVAAACLGTSVLLLSDPSARSNDPMHRSL